jgi:hypothetical protein
MAVAALAALLVVAGYGSTRARIRASPKPIAYDEATLKKISQALRALLPDNVLHQAIKPSSHQAMEDHENERDDLRFCP